MDNIILGTFGTLAMHTLNDKGHITFLRQLSDVSCLNNQIINDKIVKLVYLKQQDELELLTYTSLNNFSTLSIKIEKYPINFILSPKGTYITVVYDQLYKVIDLKGEILINDIKVVDPKYIGQFDASEQFFSYQEELEVKTFSIADSTTTVVHTAKTARLIQISYIKSILIIASSAVSQADPGYIRVFKETNQIMNKNFQSADQFQFVHSQLGSWFVAIVKVEINSDGKNYNYYGTKQVFSFDLISFRHQSLSGQSQQVHGIDSRLIDENTEHLFYILDKVPTQLKFAEIKTLKHAVQLNFFQLGHKTKINSLKLGKTSFLLRGEAAMDGECYFCKIQEGNNLKSKFKICGKEKIFYKTHTAFSNNDKYILMGTLAPRLNVDNGISVRDGTLKEVFNLSIPKLQVMVVLGRGQGGDWPKNEIVEYDINEQLQFDDAAAAASNVYVPPGMRAQQKQPKPATESVSLF